MIEYVTQCCECGKVKVQDQWYPKDISGVNLQSPEVRVTHGYCRPCYDEAMRTIEKEAPLEQAAVEEARRIMNSLSRNKRDTQLELR